MRYTRDLELVWYLILFIVTKALCALLAAKIAIAEKCNDKGWQTAATILFEVHKTHLFEKNQRPENNAFITEYKEIFAHTSSV